MDCRFLNLKRVNCYTSLPILTKNLRMDYYDHTLMSSLSITKNYRIWCLSKNQTNKTNLQLEIHRDCMYFQLKGIQLIYCASLNFKVCRFCVIVSLVNL